MTLKTDTKFDDSPVLRSLEKVAVERGLVTPDPVVKQASAEELYAPTDDLHEDILALVDGLRAKGLHREADMLEDKANVRKMAETHLYRVIDEDGEDLLDFAHPEGDVEVAPSSSGLGKVWTEQSAKKEILRVVNKKPTGKNSERYEDLKKVAQDVPWGGRRSDVTPRGGGTDIEGANTQIASLWSELDTYKNGAVAGLGASSDFWNFKEQKVMDDPTHAKSYVEKTPVSAKDIADYKALLKAAYGSTKVGNVGDIYRRTAQGGVTDALYATTKLDYFWGSKPYTVPGIVIKDFWKKEKPAGKWNIDNDSAIWAWDGSKWYRDRANTAAAAQAVQKMVEQRRAAIFGENLATASAAAKKKAGKFASLAAKQFGDTENPVQLVKDETGDVTTSATNGIKQANLIARKIKALINPSGPFIKRYEALVKSHSTDAPMDWSKFNSSVESAVGTLGQIANVIMPFAKKAPTHQAQANFNKAARILKQYADTFTNTESDEYKEVMSLLNRSLGFSRAIGASIKRGEEAELHGKSGAELLEISKKWLQNTVNYTGYTGKADDATYSSVSHSTVKTAQDRPKNQSPFKFPGGRSGGSGYKQKPGAGTAGGGGATSSIQTELLNLAKLIEKYQGHEEAIKRLKMEPHGKDNIWGTATVDALKTAESIRSKYQVQSPAIAPTNTAATAANLKAMIAAINAGKWTMPGGAGAKGVEIYDKYGDVPITSKDLMSPADLYLFMIQKMGMKRLYNEYGEEYLKVSTFEGYINGLVKRAQMLLGKQTADKDRQRSARFLRAAHNLKQQFQNVLSYAAKDWYRKAGGKEGTGAPPYTADVVRGADAVQVEYLYMAPGGGKGDQGAGGVGYKQKGKPGGKGAAPGEDVVIKLIGLNPGTLDSDYPPISQYIDLSDSRWWDVDLKEILDWNVVDRMSGPNFALTYFSDEPDPMTAAVNFFRDLRSNLTRTWKEYSRTITNPKLRRADAMSVLAAQLSYWQKTLVNKEEDIIKYRRRRKRR